MKGFVLLPDFRVSRHLTLLDAGGHAVISRDEAQKIMTQISRGEIWSGEFDVRGSQARRATSR